MKKRDDLVWAGLTLIGWKKLHGLNVAPFLAYGHGSSHRRVGTRWMPLCLLLLRGCVICRWVKRSAVLSSTCCETVEAGQDRDGKKRRGMVTVWGIPWAVSQTLSADYQRPEREPRAARVHPPIRPHPPRVSCPFLAGEKGGESTSRAKYFHSEESPCGRLLLFLSAGADRKQWRPVL